MPNKPRALAFLNIGKRVLLNRALVASFLFISSLFFVACEKNETTSKAADPSQETEVIEPANFAQQKKSLWLAGEQVLTEFLKSADALNSCVHDFTQQPQQEKLKSCQSVWQQAQLTFRKFFFFSKLGKASPEFSSLSDLLFRINQYPIQPGILDSVGAYAYSGIVNQIGTPINAELLENIHGMTDDNEVALGLYAIQFVLFGESDRRVASDFISPKMLSPEQKKAGYKSVEELPEYRRQQLLKTQSQLLLQDASKLQKMWASDGPNSFQRLWQDSAYQNFLVLLRTSLSLSLTEALIEFVHFQQSVKNDDAEAKAKETKPHTEEKTESGDVTPEMTSPEKKIYAVHALESIQLAAELLNNDELNSALASALTSVKNPETSNPWRDAYESMKIAGNAIPL